MDDQYEQELQRLLPELKGIGGDSAFWFMSGVAWTFRISLHDVLEKLQDITQEHETLKASHHLLQRRVTALEATTTPLVELTSSNVVDAIERNTTKVAELLEKLTLSQIADSAIAKTMLAQKSVERKVEHVPQNVPPQKQSRTKRKGGTKSVTKGQVLQFYAQIGEQSLRKAADHFGVSHTTIKRILKGD